VYRLTVAISLRPLCSNRPAANVADTDNIAAEFGIIIRSYLKGGGLGHILMDKIIRYARDNGTQRLVGTVITENRPMLELARELGFVLPSTEGAGQSCEIALKLQ
jgi:acetyltransferase